MLGHVLLISAQVNREERRAGARSGHVRPVRRSAARRRRRCVNGVRGRVERLHRAAQRAKRRTSELQAASWPTRSRAPAAARAGRSQTRRSSSCSSCATGRHCRRPPPRSSARPPTPDFRTVTIDKGTRDGLRADMAVIAPAGVVGRVVVPSAPRRQGAAAHRSERRGRRADRALARAGRRRRRRRRTRCGWTMCPRRPMSSSATSSSRRASTASSRKDSSSAGSRRSRRPGLAYKRIMVTAGGRFLERSRTSSSS